MQFYKRSAGLAALIAIFLGLLRPRLLNSPQRQIVALEKLEDEKE